LPRQLDNSNESSPESPIEMLPAREDFLPVLEESHIMRAMEDQFKNVEKEFKQLSKEFRQKSISEIEFKNRLKDLRLKDQDGRFWTIGAQTGKWYYFDGEDWIESNPPSLQEKKAICVHCGFENDLENEACSYCGESLKEEEFTCPKCGRKLDRFSFFCPDCDQDEEEKVWEPTGEIEFEEEDEKREQEKKSEPEFEEEEEKSEQILRYIHPLSMVLFFGAVGLLVGIIIGAFAGATDFLFGVVGVLPPFMRELQGNLMGGIFYGILGGIFGFIALGLIGFLSAQFFNLIFSLIGGIRLHIE
jgi:hypothetical protein